MVKELASSYVRPGLYLFHEDLAKCNSRARLRRAIYIGELLKAGFYDEEGTTYSQVMILLFQYTLCTVFCCQFDNTAFSDGNAATIVRDAMLNQLSDYFDKGMATELSLLGVVLVSSYGLMFASSRLEEVEWPDEYNLRRSSTLPVDFCSTFSVVYATMRAVRKRIRKDNAVKSVKVPGRRN